MSDLQPGKTVINIDGIERRIFFSFSVIDSIQEKYDKPFDEVMKDYIELFAEEKLPEGMKMTADLLEIFANDDYIYPDKKDRHPVTAGYFYSFVSSRNVSDIFGAIWEQYIGDLPEADEEADQD